MSSEGGPNDAEKKQERLELLLRRKERMRDALRAKMMTTTTTTTTTSGGGGGRRADIEEEEEEEEEDEEKETRNALERALASVSWRRRHATTLREAVENEKRRNDALERRVREREKRARAIAMAKRTPGRRRGKNLFDTTTKVDDRELSRIRLKSCEFEVRCERSRVFRDVKNVFELEAKRIKSSGKSSGRSIDCYGKVLPDVDAFAYSSKQQQQQQQHATHNKGDLDEFIGALFSTNENEDENENEIAAMLSMMNRFVALLGKYSFCPSLHRSTPGVTNATEIWKPVDSTTTTCSSRNFEPDGKESFDDDDDDYERDEAVKVNEFFRKTFGNEDVVVYGDIATPECEMLPLYYFRADARNSVGEEDGRTKKKRLLRAVRLLQKSCEIVASHLAAEVTELATSDIFEVEDEDEHQYSFSRCLMREMGNTNKATRSGPFCSLLVAFEALIELAERTRLQNLYYYSSSSSASTSCDELFSSEEEQEENDNEGLEPVVVISPSLRNIDNTVTSKTTTTTKKRKSKKSSRKLLAEKSKSMIKSVWGFVAEPTKKLENNSKLTRVLEKNEDEKDENRERDKHHACDDEKDDEDWDVIDVPHTLIRKTSSSNNDSKKKNIRLPPPPCEEENLDHYVRAMFTDKQ
jgi:hypothetical protein